jgi:hypothetical protein
MLPPQLARNLGNPIHLSKVSVEFRKLPRNLRFAGRRHRIADVDVDVGHHRAVRRRTEFSEIEHQTALDTTIGRPKPLGARGAVMADTLGASVPPMSKEH